MIFLRFLRYFCWSGVYNGPPLYEIISTTSKWFTELRIDVKVKTQWYNYLFKVINKNTWLMYWRKPCTACSEFFKDNPFVFPSIVCKSFVSNLIFIRRLYRGNWFSVYSFPLVFSVISHITKISMVCTVLLTFAWLLAYRAYTHYYNSKYQNINNTTSKLLENSLQFSWYSYMPTACMFTREWLHERRFCRFF